MDFYKQQLTLDWQGMTLSVTFQPYWLGTDTGHIEVRSPMTDCSGGGWTIRTRRPLPITETGFRSIFVPASVMEAWDGPLPYLIAMLDIEAERPEWKKAEAGRRQLTLF